MLVTDSQAFSIVRLDRKFQGKGIRPDAHSLLAPYCADSQPNLRPQNVSNRGRGTGRIGDLPRALHTTSRETLLHALSRVKPASIYLSAITSPLQGWQRRSLHFFMTIGS